MPGRSSSVPETARRRNQAWLALRNGWRVRWCPVWWHTGSCGWMRCRSGNAGPPFWNAIGWRCRGRAAVPAGCIRCAARRKAMPECPPPEPPSFVRLFSCNHTSAVEQQKPRPDPDRGMLSPVLRQRQRLVSGCHGSSSTGSVSSSARVASSRYSLRMMISVT